MKTKYSLKQTLLVSALGFSFTSAAIGQTDEQVIVEIDEPAQTAAQITQDASSPADDTQQQIERYLAKTNQSIINAGKSHLFKFYSGTAQIPVTKDNPDWAIFRANALDEAVASAREEYLKTVNTSVMQETVKEFFKERGLPEPTADEFKSQSTFEQLMDKAIAVVDTALLNQLKGMGIDAAKFESSPPQKKQTLLRQYFGTKTVTTAYGDISGLTVTKTFENYLDNGKGTVGVIMVLSADRRDQIVDMVNSDGQIAPSPEKANPKFANINAALSENPAPYLNKGVRVHYDAQGYPMLIAYGQSGVTYSSDPDETYFERKAAYDFAESDAWGSLASAYNLSGEYSQSALSAKTAEKERMSTLVGPGSVSTATTGIQHSIRSSLEASTAMTAKVSGLNGVTFQHKWRAKHPASGKEMVGVALVWHPIAVQETINLQSGKRATDINQSTVNANEPVNSTTSKSYESDDGFDLADF